MKHIKYLAVILAVISSIACTRIETGEVGVRLNASKQIEGAELMAGTWNQTLIGEVLTFPVKDVTMNIDNKTPMTADNSALADFDITAIYNIQPNMVAELYSTKSQGFHAKENGDTYLMWNYLITTVNNAAYKVVRQYKALEVADNRQVIEQKILAEVNANLKEAKLDNAISFNLIQVRNVLPNAEILKSATDYVKSQNELKVKENEIKIAEAEAKRMQMLANNSQQSIAYMKAQSELNISEAVKAGKVQTILIPHNLTMFSQGK